MMSGQTSCAAITLPIREASRLPRLFNDHESHSADHSNLIWHAATPEVFS